MEIIGIMMHSFLLLMCLFGLVYSDNSTVDNFFGLTSTGVHEDTATVSQGPAWGEWSKWSACTRSCGGGLTRQQRRCRRKPCKGKSGSVKYKICNNQMCQEPSDFRAEQCSTFNNVPYSGQLLKWYPHHDPMRPCSLICRGTQNYRSLSSSLSSLDEIERSVVIDDQTPNKVDAQMTGVDDSMSELDSDESIVVQLADKVEDGTKCGPDSLDVCIDGICMKIGCDMRVGSGRSKDACGICGGNGSSCQPKYTWSLASISACSKSCGGGFKMAMAICKSSPDESVVEDVNCHFDERPTKTLLPCNTHLCSTKWITGEWSRCSASCGGGSRTRPVFCTEENGNETTKLPDHRCIAGHKPRSQENCNTISCPMWETNQWSQCSVTCGSGIRTRTIECRDGDGRLSSNCDLAERPHEEQECKTSIACPAYSEEKLQPAMQSYPAPPPPEKLIDQPIPSESTFITDEWSSCSATCGEGIRHREVHCKIFLEFSRTIAKLPDHQCSGPKPPETEKCNLKPCGPLENNLSYRIDTVGDSGYEEANLMDSYKSSASSGSDYESSVKVAPGNSGQTTYSWKEGGYSACTASCLGGVQDLIINCVRDDTGKTVIPLLCTKETKPESRIRTCNDHACTPRWNYSDFSPCNSPCGIGIQTRDVTCIHEVARGPGNTVVVPNHMCQTPPPVDRQHCNVWDCPPKWQSGEWDKCSKSCGNGIRRREVVCEQVMAQGHKQIVPDRECQGRKPAAESPCNTRSCHEVGVTAQPVILSQNTTFTQRDPEQHVDLKIGMTAMVFQGIPMVKIRCPVKKFHKAQIVWTKDRAEIHKSRKYKISRKGALKIIDIGLTDGGVYGCIAGQAHSELHLIVKHRTREQMSSEEILRFGNNVQHRHDVNLDSGSANSGENLQIDRAAPAYQGAFAFGNDDLSHESRPEIPTSGKPTKKPRRKSRPKPSPSSDPNSHGEYPVTSIHQPGYHESVESTATSGATRLLPHFTQLITTLKSLWPFREASKRNHRTAPVKSKMGYHRKLSSNNDNPVSADDNLRYDSINNEFGMFGHNSVIPDETFGPDEERIFIDDDPYDMDAAILAIDQLEDIRGSGKSIVGKTKPISTTKSTDDYLENALKNAKNSEDIALDNFVRSQRGLENENSELEKTNIQQETTQPLIDMFSLVDDSEKEIKVMTGHPIPPSTSSTPENLENELHTTEENIKDPLIVVTFASAVVAGDKSNSNFQNNYDFNGDNSKISTGPSLAYLPDDDDKTSDSGSEMEQNEDSYETELAQQKLNRNNTTISSGNETSIVNEMQTKADENTRETDLENVDLGALEVLSNEDVLDKTTEIAKTEVISTNTRHHHHHKHKNHSHNTSRDDNSKGLAVELETLAFEKNDPSSDVGRLNIFSKGVKEDMVFEWVTTDWSKCSQTCGGGGFQMRGTQCTVRSTKSSTNSTQVPSRTVIGASLCEDAGFPVPQKVRACGSRRCPQWHADNWTPCESSRCFNWKTAMQRRDITCRITEEISNGTLNVTVLDSNECDDGIKPPQRQECYNDACKGVWRVGEWSECNTACEEDGIKYRILQCVWYGTKKPAGNACRDLLRPSVMKACKGIPCPRTPGECEDHSQLCDRVKKMQMCDIPLYQKQCCKSCR